MNVDECSLFTTQGIPQKVSIIKIPMTNDDQVRCFFQDTRKIIRSCLENL